MVTEMMITFKMRLTFKIKLTTKMMTTDTMTITEMLTNTESITAVQVKEKLAESTLESGWNKGKMKERADEIVEMPQAKVGPEAQIWSRHQREGKLG